MPYFDLSKRQQKPCLLSTIITVKPLLHKFLWKILVIEHDDSATTKQAIKGNLIGHYQHPSVQRIMNVATYLDPRYKQLPFLDDFSKELVIKDVLDEIGQLNGLNVPEADEIEDCQDASNINGEEPPAKK